MTVRQKQTIRKTLSLMSLTIAVALAMTMLFGSFDLPQTSGMQQELPHVAGLSPDIDTDWRYTKNGWQQIGGLYSADFAPLRTFESIHPFIWAAAVVMAVIGTTIWATNEWELARLLNLDD